MHSDQFDRLHGTVKPWRLLLIVGGLLAAGFAAFFLLRPPAAPTMATRPVTLALPIQLSSALPMVALDRNLFRQAGVEVINQPFLMGKDALRSVLEGKADLAAVSDVPFTYAVLNGNDIAMLAGISQSRRTLALVARKDQAISRVQDLRGKSIGLTKGGNVHYFLDAILSINRISESDVTLVDLKTDAVIDAFTRGKIDAAVVFQPYLSRLEQEMNGRIQVFYGEDIYSYRFLLVGKPAWIDAHPQEIQRVLTSLVAAKKFITEKPVAARLIVGKYLKVDDIIMKNMFDVGDYELTLDQAMLLALDDQSRWAMQSGLVKRGQVPNFIQYMNYRYLEAALPSAVKIIH
jgi:NitT/TauT family transport system substrate-binding protein